MEECGYCKKKQNKVKNYLEDIEKEKIRECQKAMEREKITRGMMCTKEDEKRLRDMQKLQMEEKRMIEQQEHDLEMMWHNVLLDDYSRKEQFEKRAEYRRQQEMIETRMCYENQIANTNRKRQEILQMEREKENRRLEKIRKKMEQDHCEAIKRKKEQQLTNRKNFIEGHQMKLAKLESEKMRAREIDTGTIKASLESLRQEQERNRIQMKSLQMEKLICVENYNRERRIALALEEEAAKIADEWQQQEHKKTDDIIRNLDHEKITNKQRAAEDYEKHLNKKNMEQEKAKQERSERMQRVGMTAVGELHRNMDQANMELKRQLEYRNCLSKQIRNNEKHLDSELINIKNKDIAFTKKAVLFKDAMVNRLQSSPGRASTNPIHPFRRLMESNERDKAIIHLPSLG